MKNEKLSSIDQSHNKNTIQLQNLEHLSYTYDTVQKSVCTEVYNYRTVDCNGMEQQQAIHRQKLGAETAVLI